jgi:hypothetical protein
MTTEEIIAALPKTADGHPIVPGMALYRTDNGLEAKHVISVRSGGADVYQGHELVPWCGDYCYAKLSSAYAALAESLAAKGQ